MKCAFETTSDDDAERCKIAFQFGRTVTVRGMDILTRKSTEYIGRVLSVSYSSGKPWQIGIETS
jgi:hypothetical protein